MPSENKKEIEEKLRKELQASQSKSIWEGGYYEGDPLDPMGRSNYGIIGYMSVIHVVYLVCIKPYVDENSMVLEIGPGKGAWTKTLLAAKEIWCLDALSAEHNKFWEYVGRNEKIKYIQVNDFACNELPENKFNYFFSFGTLCHISFEGITEYMKSIYPKLTNGAQCFIMALDYEKYNNAINNINSLNFFRVFETFKPKTWHAKLALKYLVLYLKSYWGLKQKYLYPMDLKEDNIPRPTRLYNAGIKRTCDMLQKIGYKINSPDMCVLNRDPIIHFSKP